MTTSHAIMEALRCGPFRAPAHVLLENVANGTGFSVKRWADAIALSVWPSRGVYLAGIEVKVSRGDWKRELDEPAKAAELQRFCRYWWIATPPKLVEISELPETWGLLEVHGKTVRTVRTAPKLEEQPPTAAIMAAILRRAGENWEAATQARLEAAREALKPAPSDRELASRAVSAEHNAQSLQRQLDEMRAAAAAFEKASGVSPLRRWDPAGGDPGQRGHAFRFTLELERDLARSADTFGRQATQLAQVIDRLRTSQAELIEMLRARPAPAEAV